MSRSLSVLLSLTFLAAPMARAEAQDDPKAIAVKVTADGAALFDARDAKGLAQTYAEDARLDFYSKDKDSGAIKLETKIGRAEIQAGYEEYFKTLTTLHAKNTIENSRMLDNDLMQFSGIFEPNSEAAESMKLPFSQVRKREGDSWKIVSLQLFLLPGK